MGNVFYCSKKIKIFLKNTRESKRKLSCLYIPAHTELSISDGVRSVESIYIVTYSCQQPHILHEWKQILAKIVIRNRWLIDLSEITKTIS